MSDNPYIAVMRDEAMNGPKEKQVMTGKEWYDRFEVEYAKLGGGVPREKAFEAARKAANLDEA